MRSYTVVFSNITITVPQDLFAIVAAAGKTAAITGFEICNVGGTADAGDAQEELLRLRIRSGQTTAGSGGAVGTVVPTNVTTSAAGFTARTNDTTIASAGTIVQHLALGWNVRQPYLWLPPENMWIWLTGGRRATIELVSTPADALSVNGTVYVVETG